MFGKKETGPSARQRPAAARAQAASLAQPESIRTPPNTGGGVGAWFAMFQKPIWDKRLAVKAAALFALIAIGEAFAIARMSEHSGPKPYFVEHDPKTGAVWVSDRYAQEYTPTAANNRYFLVKWATRVYTISADSADTIHVQLPAAAAWTVGAATTELDTLVTQTDPIAERVVKVPGLTRKFQENSTSFSPDGRQAYMIFTTTESIAGKPQPPKQQLLTITFVDAPDTLKPGEELDNPLGMRITNFIPTPYTGVAPGATQ